MCTAHESVSLHPRLFPLPGQQRPIREADTMVLAATVVERDGREKKLGDLLERELLERFESSCS